MFGLPPPRHISTPPRAARRFVVATGASLQLADVEDEFSRAGGQSGEG
jgi:hypothetical protein